MERAAPMEEGDGQPLRNLAPNQVVAAAAVAAAAMFWETKNNNRFEDEMLLRSIMNVDAAGIPRHVTVPAPWKDDDDGSDDHGIYDWNKYDLDDEERAEINESVAAVLSNVHLRSSFAAETKPPPAASYARRRISHAAREEEDGDDDEGNKAAVSEPWSSSSDDDDHPLDKKPRARKTVCKVDEDTDDIGDNEPKKPFASTRGTRNESRLSLSDKDRPLPKKLRACKTANDLDSFNGSEDDFGRKLVAPQPHNATKPAAKSRRLAQAKPKAKLTCKAQVVKVKPDRPRRAVPACASGKHPPASAATGNESREEAEVDLKAHVWALWPATGVSSERRTR
jgi:hypothetical protein